MKHILLVALACLFASCGASDRDNREPDAADSRTIAPAQSDFDSILGNGKLLSFDFSKDPALAAMQAAVKSVTSDAWIVEEKGELCIYVRPATGESLTVDATRGLCFAAFQHAVSGKIAYVNESENIRIWILDSDANTCDDELILVRQSANKVRALFIEKGDMELADYREYEDVEGWMETPYVVGAY